jgi:hypothetical protein
MRKFCDSNADGIGDFAGLTIVNICANAVPGIF